MAFGFQSAFPFRRYLEANGAFDISDLFANGEQGVWYDPSDLSTMFQDAAGTIPVTGIEQPVGLILDKSGRGNHARQTLDTARPVLQQDANGSYYLRFNGLDAFLETAPVSFTHTGNVMMAAGVTAHHLVTATIGMVVNHNGAAVRSFYMAAPTSINAVGIAYVGATKAGLVQAAGLSSPSTAVLVGTIDLAAPLGEFRRNGVRTGVSTTPTGGGTFSNMPLSVGRQGSIFKRYLNGHLYALIVRGAATSEPQVIAVESYVNSKIKAF